MRSKYLSVSMSSLNKKSPKINNLSCLVNDSNRLNIYSSCCSGEENRGLYFVMFLCAKCKSEVK